MLVVEIYYRLIDRRRKGGDGETKKCDLSGALMTITVIILRTRQRRKKVTTDHLPGLRMYMYNYRTIVICIKIESLSLSPPQHIPYSDCMYMK